MSIRDDQQRLSSLLPTKLVLRQMLAPKRPAMDHPTIVQIAIWVILTLLAVFQSLSDFSAFQIGVYQDDASYVVLAQSLVKADRYGLMNMPGEPGPTRYPFGFPLLLSPFAKFFPGNPDIMKTLSLAAVIFNSSLLFWGWRSFSRSTSYWWGLAVSGLLTLSPITHGLSRTIMSEPIFTTFCLLAVILAERAIWGEFNAGWRLGMSLTLVMILFIRTAGIAVLLAVFAYWFLARGKSMIKEITWVSAGMAGWVGLLILLTPISLNSLVPAIYMQQIENPAAWGENQVEEPFLPRTFSALWEYTNSLIQESVLPVGGGTKEQQISAALGMPLLPEFIGLGVTLIIVLGFAWWVKREGLSLPMLIAVLFLGILLPWPWRMSRFLYPIQSQLVFGFLFGITYLETAIANQLPWSLPRRKAGTITIILVVLLLALFAYKNLEKDTSINHTGDLKNRTAWIRANTQPDSVIMTDKPQVDYIYADRKTLPFPSVSSLEIFAADLQDSKADYILIAPELTWKVVYTPDYSDQTRQLLTWLEVLASQGRIKRIYASGTEWVQVFQVIH